MFYVVMAMLIFSGCQEEQRERSVWGQGELPAEFAGYFGDDNTARLNFVQIERFNALNQNLVAFAKENAAQHNFLHERIKKLEAIDPNDYRGPMGPPGEDCRVSADDIVQNYELADFSGPGFSSMDLSVDTCGRTKDEPCGWRNRWCALHDGRIGD